jgi:hypothetical protein
MGKRLFISSRPIRWALLSVVALGSLVTAYSHFSSSSFPSPETAAEADVQALAHQRIAQLPLAFEVNRGQVDTAAQYLVRGAGYQISLEPTAATITLATARARTSKSGEETNRDAKPTGPSVVRMILAGANPKAEPEGLQRQSGVSHYLRGNDSRLWLRDIEHYAQVKYHDVYAGVDLVYYGNQRRLEYDFIVGPKQDPGQIALDFEGVQALRIDERGDLVLSTAQGDLIQHKPLVYQQLEGQRRVIDARYALLDDRRIGFAFGEYDRSRALVIDPVLSYSSYLGGSGTDSAGDVAVDVAGNVYITGLTNSIDFPLATRAAGVGKWDVFVSKLNAAGGLVYSAYLGGSEDDIVHDLAVDGLGNVYVTGETKSSNFPTAGAFQAALGANPEGPRTDAFVAKLNATGSALVYSTYLGGDGNDSGWGIAVDANGNAYVTGSTTSFGFPLKNALQTALKAGSDAFVSKLNATGSALVYSTYLGGSTGTTLGGGADYGYAIAVDAAGNAYVAGNTRSTNFPTVSALQSTFGGEDDVFVTKLNTAGSALAYSTYLGGSGYEHPEAITVDGGGNVYVVGQTGVFAGANNFPTATPLQVTWAGGDSDAFISKLNAAGNALLYSTYLGGSGYDYANGVAIDAAGNAHVTGATTSGNFPIASAWQAGFSGSDGNEDAFVSKLNASGNALVYSSYLGGSGGDTGNGIAVDKAGNAYVAGGTNSGDFPTANPWQPAYKGNSDAFLTKIDGGATAPRRTFNDFNYDGKADILWRNARTGLNTIWSAANSATAQGVTGVTNLDWIIAGVGDFDGNGKADILWRNARTGLNTIWRGAVSSNQQSVTAVANLAWKVAGVGDFDGDGKADVLWRNTSTGANSLWKSGNSTTAQAVTSVTLEWKVVGVADYNGDGKADVLWRSTTTGANAIWPSANFAQRYSITGVTDQAWVAF